MPNPLLQITCYSGYLFFKFVDFSFSSLLMLIFATLHKNCLSPLPHWDTRRIFVLLYTCSQEMYLMCLFEIQCTFSVNTRLSLSLSCRVHIKRGGAPISFYVCSFMFFPPSVTVSYFSYTARHFPFYIGLPLRCCFIQLYVTLTSAVTKK